jgi:hypothetical protein
VPSPDEEPLPELPLQGVQPSGEGGLRHIKGFRRAADAVEPGDFKEPLDVYQEH